MDPTLQFVIIQRQMAERRREAECERLARQPRSTLGTIRRRRWTLRQLGPSRTRLPVVEPPRS